MKQHGKKYRAALEKIEPARKYNLETAITKIKEIAFAKFDETVELTVWLGVDPRKADQLVRGTLVLPHGLGKSKTVLVIAQGDKLREAEEAGADIVGGEDVVTRIKGGWTDFDAVIATPDMMRLVGGLGKVLGPRGLMPNPKTGTVTFDVATAIRETKAGKVEYRVDKTGVIHVGVGKRQVHKESEPRCHDESGNFAGRDVVREVGVGSSNENKSTETERSRGS